MKKRLILFLVLMPLAISAQNDTLQLRFTLEECIEYAFGNSYERQSMELSNKSKLQVSSSDGILPRKPLL